jgi:hypothetical protein
MEKRGRRILLPLLLAVALWACGSASPSPANPGASSGETSVVLNLPSQIPSYTIDPGSEPGENPADSVTAGGSSGEATPGEGTPAKNTPVRLGTPICNDSLFVQDVTIPDGTVLKPGQSFKKTWRLKNTGICAWTTEYALGFAYGDQMKGSATKLPNAVSPGGTVDVTLNLRAPLNRCWYGSWWRLKTDRGDYFGDFVFVSIQVADDSDPNTPDPSVCPDYIPPP